MGPEGSSRRKMGGTYECGNEVTRWRSGYSRVLQTPALQEAWSLRPQTFTSDTHTLPATRIRVPGGRTVLRTVSHALAVPYAPCHTHTHRVTQGVTRSVSHSRYSLPPAQLWLSGAI